MKLLQISAIIEHVRSCSNERGSVSFEEKESPEKGASFIMIESFLEENVTGKDTQFAKRKYRIFQAASIISIILGCIGLVFVYLSLYLPVEEGGSIMSVVVILIFYVVMTAGCFVLAYVFRRFRNNAIVDYDYTFVSGSLRIAKIINQTKRRPLIAVDCDTIEAMDKIEADTFKRYETMSGVKKVLATPNMNVEEANLYYLFCKKDGQPTLLIFEPSDALLIQIRRNSKNILRR